MEDDRYTCQTTDTLATPVPSGCDPSDPTPILRKGTEETTSPVSLTRDETRDGEGWTHWSLFGQLENLEVEGMSQVFQTHFYFTLVLMSSVEC